MDSAAVEIDGSVMEGVSNPRLKLPEKLLFGSANMLTEANS